MTTRGLWQEHYCEECDQRFSSNRFDAKFCSSTCRSRSHRKAQARDKAIARAKKAIDDLRQYYRSPVVADVMQDLMKFLQNATADHEFYVEMRTLDTMPPANQDGEV